MLIPKIGRVKSSTAVPWRGGGLTASPPTGLTLAYRAGHDPEPIPAPGNGWVVGVERGVGFAVAPSAGEVTSSAGLSLKESQRILRAERRLARASGVELPQQGRTVISQLKSTGGDRRNYWVGKTSANLLAASVWP